MDYLDLKVAENKKTKKWFKKIYDSYIPHSYTYFSNDIESRKALYELYNSDISFYEDRINRMCDNLVDYGASKKVLIPFNVWTNKLQILESGIANRMNDFKAVLLTQKSIKEKNQELQRKINETIERDLALISQGLEPEQIEAMRADMTPEDAKFKNYTSDLEIFCNRMIKYIIKTSDFQNKVKGSFRDTIIQSAAFVYCGWKHGKPHFEEVNNLFCGFHKSPDVSRVEKGDYFWSTKYVTLGDAMDELVNKLSTKELKELIGGGIEDLSDDAHVKNKVFNKLLVYAQIEAQYLQKHGINPQRVGLYQGDYENKLATNYRISRTHLEFKGYKKVIYLSTTNELGKKETIVINNDKAVIPKEASRMKYYNEQQEEKIKYVWEENGKTYEAIVIYIPRKYECTAWSNGKIFTDCREVPNQPTYKDDPFGNFELSYKGGFINSRNAEPISLLEQAVPQILQYITIKNLQVREISKYTGYERIQDIAQTIDEIGGDAFAHLDPVVRQEMITKELSTRYFNSEKTNGGLKSPTRPAGISHSQIGNANEFILLQNFAQLVDQSIGMALGVPPAREGQLVANTNVRDNQMSIQQTTLHTELYISWLQEVYKTVLTSQLKSWIVYFKNWFRNNPNEDHYLLEYITSDGTKELIEVTPDYLNLEDIGLFVETSVDSTYRDIMLQKIAQNTFDPATSGNTSMILKAITSNASNEEIHRMIEVEQEKMQKQQQEQMQREQELIQEQKAAQRDLMAYQNELKVLSDTLKEEQKRMTTLQAASIEVNKFKLQNDVDENGVNDMIKLQEIKESNENKRLDKKLEVEKMKIISNNKNK